MRKYKVIAYVGLETHKQVIEAKNLVEANKLALDFGHKKSDYGSGKFLRGVSVKAVKSN